MRTGMRGRLCSGQSRKEGEKVSMDSLLCCGSGGGTGEAKGGGGGTRGDNLQPKKWLIWVHRAEFCFNTFTHLANQGLRFKIRKHYTQVKVVTNITWPFGFNGREQQQPKQLGRPMQRGWRHTPMLTLRTRWNLWRRVLSHQLCERPNSILTRWETRRIKKQNG